jgi:hypothetical protein
MKLREIGGGKAFREVTCVLVDFKKNKDRYSLSLQDEDSSRQAYIMGNLYGFSQMKELKGRRVMISGLHEPGIPNIVPDNVKVKEITEAPAAEDGEDSLLASLPHITDERMGEIIQRLKQFVQSVGNEVPSYRHLLEIYFSDANITRMRTLPATHVRQGSPLGGMLHATLVVTELAYSDAMHYIKCANGVYSFADRRSVNWDLLLTGALMHLCGNLIYYGEEIPHLKTDVGVEQGFSNCRQQYILKTAIVNHINISDEEMGSLIGIMARLNEQGEGIQKCRHEAYFLENAYRLFQQMDSFDSEIVEYLQKYATAADGSEESKEELEKIYTSHTFLRKTGRYVSAEEIRRKAEIMGLKKEEGREQP